MTAPAVNRPPADDPRASSWALIERAQAGDTQAFGEIYQRNFDTIFKFVHFRVRNWQLAEDLTGDVFLRGLSRIDTFTYQGRDIGAWLMTIAKNRVIDYFKSARYQMELSVGSIYDGEQTDRPDHEPSPEDAVITYLSDLDLLSAVKQLSPDQQQCIVLRFLNGCSIAETAQAMGKPEGAIKALQYRATRTLFRLMTADQAEPVPPTVVDYFAPKEA